MNHKMRPVGLAILLLISGCGGGSSTTQPGAETTYINDIITSTQTLFDFNIYGSTNVYYFRSGVLADLNNDGKNEFVLSVSPYPQKPVPLIILGDQPGSLLHHEHEDDVLTSESDQLYQKQLMSVLRLKRHQLLLNK